MGSPSIVLQRLVARRMFGRKQRFKRQRQLQLDNRGNKHGRACFIIATYR
jgi:hypothetical protein